MPESVIRVIDAYVYKKLGDGIQFLLLKRAKTKIYEHLWQGVAGKIELEEKAWESAIRELKEETGLNPLKIFVADHVSRFYEVYGDRINLIPVFGIEVSDLPVKLSKEHSEFEWLSYNDALNRLVWRGQKMGLTVVHDMTTKEDDRMRWSEIKIEENI
ncbi:MAG: NUDIX pyrophosphatase [Candidatus Marinimicrobia bacterium]|jgi:dATP pyrophosphohydrolase|nr:NUDIX pyrophosphatase [Candidatus Neomarinimicrobiota bacterium]MBT3937744.1 NUDIX pyrophosphatase [Candidatus Neomarinimicrobiota bacterium]MBT3962300.1 NUDIX pyrophosphatase [Candidatus Neomarinimicrobiota bacterium]MBT4382553.1 NUDIX pyrophosphatase [Candidatus Neomarinimicrobiota bacterium]MBT4635160.1 NUDIX pyrophosphatase [Candidatus Neomarinimicrobiota bacterium]